MVTKSIRLSEYEAAQVREYVDATGETEASVLKRAALRGLRDFRTERGLLAYLSGASSVEASTLAGMPRASFLNLLMERGITVLDGEPTLAETLSALGRTLDDDRLTKASERLAVSAHANHTRPIGE